MADCFYHPGRDAVGACVACGKMMCVECRTMLGGKIYCQPCGDKVFTSTAAEAAAAGRPVPQPQSVSGAWWLLPIFLTWVGGLIAWAVTKGRDPQKAKKMLWWGIGLTFIYGFIWFIIVLILTLLGFGITLFGLRI